MVVLEMSMYPLDKGASVSPFVARTLDIIDRSGVDYRCHAMGTTMEGEFDTLIEVVRQCFQAMAEQCDRVEGSIRLDYRKGYENRIEGKVTSVEQKLGREVKK